jgi:hypothetical protein
MLVLAEIVIDEIILTAFEKAGVAEPREFGEAPSTAT